MTMNQAFTIFISGCSSAGKSTIALLLSEIFAEVRVGVSGEDIWRELEGGVVGGL